MTEEALVRVKWLHRLVDMVHAGCLPQVQKYKYWRIYWHRRTNTDRLPSAACACDTLVRKVRGALRSFAHLRK